MKKWFIGFSMCRSMFCAVPTFLHAWDDDCRDKMLMCLPLVGAELGIVWYAVTLLCFRFGLPSLLQGLLVGFCMYILTGFIHLDGFMDVVDAVRSYRPLTQRREILKDSHVGSFSVIAVSMLLIASVCAGASLKSPSPALIFIPMVSRSCSCIAVMALKPMQSSQYAGLGKHAPELVGMSIVLLLLIFAGLALYKAAGFSLIAVVVSYGLFLRRGYQSLAGMNGDISGYAQSISELAGIVSLVFL